MTTLPNLVDLLLLTTGTLCIHSVAQWHVADSGAKLASSLPLPDVLHDAIPFRARYLHLKEQLLGLTVASLLIVCLTRRSCVPVKQFALMWNAAFVMRSLCFVSTTLPDASQCCTVKVPCSISADGKLETGSCHDLLFSGHVTTTTLAALTVAAHVPVVAAPFYVLAGTQAFVTAASRAHYTVDVVVALLISSLIAAYFFKTKS